MEILSPDFLYRHFDSIEGVFWLLMAGVGLWVWRCVPGAYQRITIWAIMLLVTFSVSDFLQVVFGSFLLPGNEWLLVWKVANVIGFIGIFVWYVWIRLAATTD
jgi:hypothetical protein